MTHGGIPSWARVGAKVVCVDNDENAYLLPQYVGLYADGLDGLALGAVYTIREIGSDGYHSAGVRLEEIVRSINSSGLESTYNFARFRPAVPPKTEAEDLEQFLPLLASHKVKERA